MVRQLEVGLLPIPGGPGPGLPPPRPGLDLRGGVRAVVVGEPLPLRLGLGLGPVRRRGAGIVPWREAAPGRGVGSGRRRRRRGAGRTALPARAGPVPGPGLGAVPAVGAAVGAVRLDHLGRLPVEPAGCRREARRRGGGGHAAAALPSLSLSLSLSLYLSIYLSYSLSLILSQEGRVWLRALPRGRECVRERNGTERTVRRGAGEEAMPGGPEKRCVTCIGARTYA